MKKTLEPVLAGHPFFRDLAPGHLRLLVGCASNVVFQADRYLFRTGEKAEKFYLLREGRVAIELAPVAGAAINIQIVTEGEVLGWSWLIPPHEWRFDARAVELTRTVALDGRCLREKCEKDHDLGYPLLKRFSRVLSERLEATRLQLLDVYGTRG